MLLWICIKFVVVLVIVVGKVLVWGESKLMSWVCKLV